MNEPLIPKESVAKSSAALEKNGELQPSESEEAGQTAKESPTKERQFKGLARWGPWRRWSHYRESRHRELHFVRDQDPEDNAHGRLPNDEGVQLPGIWVAELYTPSTVGGLLQGIQNLGWEFGRNRDDSLTKWMSDVREGRQAGWVNLGLVSPPQAAHFMRERSAKLPPGVTAALPVLMSLTPSITAFVIVFLFDAESAVSLETSLRANFITTTRRTSRFRAWHLVRYILVNNDSVRFGYSIFNPDLLRREALKSQLQELEKDCKQWVRNHFPGAFYSLPKSCLPTAILLVTEQVRPLSEEAFNIRAFDGLALSRDYDSWESIEWPGARLVMPRRDDQGNRLTFACRRQDAFPDSPGYHDPTSNWTIAQRADDCIQGLLSRWAITCLLDAYHMNLSAMRDEIACDGSYRTVRDLKRLRSFARTFLFDIGACTQEIEEFAQTDLSYGHDVIKMTYVNSAHGKKHELLESLSASQVKRSQQVRREAQLLQTTLSASNDLSQTITNIRIQRLIVLLTVISIGIALWAVSTQVSGLLFNYFSK